MGFGSWSMDDLMDQAKNNPELEIEVETYEKQKGIDGITPSSKGESMPNANPNWEFFLIASAEIGIKLMGKKRPRVTKTKSGKSHTYMPEAYTIWRDEIKSWVGSIPDDIPLHIEVVGTRKFLSKWNKKKKAEMLGHPCTSYPDLDNLIGAIMDAVLDNDSNVASDNSRKEWGEDNRLLIRFYEIKWRES